MDYLKFLGFTFFAVLLIILQDRLTGPGLGSFVAIGVTIGFFVQYASRRHFIAYGSWLLLMLGWILLLANSVKAMVARHPDQLARLQLGEGVLVLLAMIVLHPLCYGLGWLVTRYWPARASANPPGTRRRKARLTLIFCGAVLLALLAGKVAEYLLQLPGKPFDTYLALGSLLLGAVVAAIAARRAAA